MYTSLRSSLYNYIHFILYVAFFHGWLPVVCERLEEEEERGRGEEEEAERGEGVLTIYNRLSGHVQL